jgi:hypothetical protein
MSEPKEKIKIIWPLAKILGAMALGSALTFAYLFCTTNPDGFSCDIHNFTAKDMSHELDT